MVTIKSHFNKIENTQPKQLIFLYFKPCFIDIITNITDLTIKVKNMLLKIIFFLAFATANASTYEINKDHSKIGFTIPYMTLSEVEGVFKDYHGTLDFDVSEQRLSKINAFILVDSIDTQDKKRDAHLKKADFFNSHVHPKIKFESHSIKKVSDRKFLATGLLEIKGIKREVKLQIVFKGRKTDHIGKESLFFSAEFDINRKDYGIIWNKTLDNNELLLGDDVKIKLIIQAQPIGRLTSFSGHLIPNTKGIEDYAKYKRGEIPKPSIKIETTDLKAPTVETPLQKPRANPAVLKSINLIECFWGFVGFCVLIGLSLLLKLQIIKIFKIKNYAENSLYSLMGDGVIILLTFLYTVWFFNLIYPNS